MDSGTSAPPVNVPSALPVVSENSNALQRNHLQNVLLPANSLFEEEIRFVSTTVRRRIALEVPGQLLVELGVECLELDGPLEEELGCHREEFRWVRGSVGVEQRRPPLEWCYD